MRNKIVAGNWKMNNGLQETTVLLQEIKKQQPNTAVEIIVAPTFVNLFSGTKLVEDTGIKIAAQNMHYANEGAFTGEIAANMLLEIGVETVILGHSERRAYFGENATLLRKKVDQALSKNMRIIFCFGEELEDRKKEQHFDVVQTQLNDSLYHLSETDWKQIVLAYEPVWAIGTGETATPEQAQEMHAFIRNSLTEQYHVNLASEVSILYGGSVKPNNAAEIFSKPDVDGGLIGGAALNATDFLAIVNAI